MVKRIVVIALLMVVQAFLFPAAKEPAKAQAEVNGLTRVDGVISGAPYFPFPA
jgi:hypothetical protein